MVSLAVVSSAEEDRLVDEILSKLRTALNDMPGCALHLLVDPTLSNPIAQHLMANFEGSRRKSQLEGAPIPLGVGDPSKRPYLVRVQDNNEDEHILSASIRVAVQEQLGQHDTDEGAVRSICGWLIDSPNSRGSVDADMQHRARVLAFSMSHRAWVMPLVGYRFTMFRYYDPRVTPYLPEILGAASWGEALGEFGVQRWYCMNRQGGLSAVGNAAQGHVEQGRWKLDAGQWRALERLGWCNRIRQLINGWELDSLPTEKAIEDAVERAMANGWHSEVDILGFARCAFALHPRFNEQEPFVSALQRLREQGNPEESFADLAYELTDVWRSIHEKKI